MNVNDVNDDNDEDNDDVDLLLLCVTLVKRTDERENEWEIKAIAA